MDNEPDVGNEVQGESPDAGDNTPGPNPAWEPVLSVLPEQFHSVVTPHFQKWDQEAQKRIETVNSQLQSFEAYKPFVEHGITSEEIEQGLRLMFEINNNPQNVYDALAKAYNFGQQTATPPVANPNNSEKDEDNEDNPLANVPPELLEKLNGQEGILKAVAQIVLNDAKAKQAAQADMELDRELKSLREKHGDFDEDYVLTKMMNNMTGEDAVNSYKEFVQRITPKPFAPTVLGNSQGGSGLPSNAIDPTKLSNKETRSLVAQMLEAAAKQQ